MIWRKRHNLHQAHDQIVTLQMSTLRENIKEYVNALEDTDKKLKQCPKNVSAISGKFSNTVPPITAPSQQREPFICMRIFLHGIIYH